MYTNAIIEYIDSLSRIVTLHRSFSDAEGFHIAEELERECLNIAWSRLDSSEKELVRVLAIERGLWPENISVDFYENIIAGEEDIRNGRIISSEELLNKIHKRLQDYNED